MEGYPEEPQAPVQGVVTLTAEDLRALLREARGGAKSMKGPDVPPFNAEGLKVMEELDRFQTGIRMKFEAEEDRYATPRARITYTYSRMEGRAAAMCVVGLQEVRYGDWLDMMQELETAFGELDPRYAWDKRLLSMRQGNRLFADYINEFRTIAQRTGFRGRALTSLLRYSLSRELEAKVSTEDVSELEFTALVEVLLRQDQALRSAPRQAWGVTRNNPPARGFATPATPAAASANPPPPNHPGQAQNFSRAQGGGGYEPMDLDRTRDRSQAICYRCNRRGHIARHCRSMPAVGVSMQAEPGRVWEVESESGATRQGKE